MNLVHVLYTLHVAFRQKNEITLQIIILLNKLVKLKIENSRGSLRGAGAASPHQPRHERQPPPRIRVYN